MLLFSTVAIAPVFVFAVPPVIVFDVPVFVVSPVFVFVVAPVIVAPTVFAVVILVAYHAWNSIPRAWQP